MTMMTMMMTMMTGWSVMSRDSDWAVQPPHQLCQSSCFQSLQHSTHPTSGSASWSLHRSSYWIVSWCISTSRRQSVHRTLLYRRSWWPSWQSRRQLGMLLDTEQSPHQDLYQLWQQLRDMWWTEWTCQPWAERQTWRDPAPHSWTTSERHGLPPRYWKRTVVIQLTSPDCSLMRVTRQQTWSATDLYDRASSDRQHVPLWNWASTPTPALLTRSAATQAMSRHNVLPVHCMSTPLPTGRNAAVQWWWWRLPGIVWEN